METEAKGWSVPTCSQEAPWRPSEEALRAAWPSLCHPSPGSRSWRLLTPTSSSVPTAHRAWQPLGGPTPSPTPQQESYFWNNLSEPHE